jgi:outer membrane receptor protein involved in Fe transport
MTQITGDLGFAMNTNIASLFVQDDWQVASKVKVLYGVRYDLYNYPTGLPGAPLASTQSFNTDKNNFDRGSAWPGRLTTRPRCARAPALCMTSRFSAATSRRCS